MERADKERRLGAFSDFAPAAAAAGERDSNTVAASADPVKSFDHMGLREDLLRGIYAYGYENPSSIQQRAIVPLVLHVLPTLLQYGGRRPFSGRLPCQNNHHTA